jgi:hypothetical protein
VPLGRLFARQSTFATYRAYRKEERTMTLSKRPINHGVLGVLTVRACYFNALAGALDTTATLAILWPQCFLVAYGLATGACGSIPARASSSCLCWDRAVNTRCAAGIRPRASDCPRYSAHPYAAAFPTLWPTIPYMIAWLRYSTRTILKVDFMQHGTPDLRTANNSIR